MGLYDTDIILFIKVKIEQQNRVSISFKRIIQKIINIKTKTNFKSYAIIYNLNFYYLKSYCLSYNISIKV